MTGRCWMAIALLCLTGPAMAEDPIDWAAEAAKDRRFLDFTLPEPGEVTYSATGCRIPPEPVITIGEKETGVPTAVLDPIVSNIQWSRRNTNIVKVNKCTCEMFYPDWQGTITEFDSLVQIRTFNEWRKIMRHYVEIKEITAKEVRRICLDAGLL